jgi:hypothetical protein
MCVHCSCGGGECRRCTSEYRKHLRDLTRHVTECLAAIDGEMAKPSSPERGKRIAAICNALNMSNDMAKRFGLGQR